MPELPSMWYDVSTLARLLLCEGEIYLGLFPVLCTKLLCKGCNLGSHLYVLHVSQKALDIYALKCHVKAK